MGTKSHWRRGKLRFYDKPMFSSVAALTTNVYMGGAAGDIVTTEKVLLGAPIYAGTFSTEGDMHFKAVVGGFLSSSSAAITFNLNWASTAIVTLATSGYKTKQAYKPFHVEFDGRIVGIHASSGQIAAVGQATIGFSTLHHDFGGTTGSTANGTKRATSNLALTASATAGLNISASFDCTSVAPGTIHQLHATYGYIRFFS